MRIRLWVFSPLLLWIGVMAAPGVAQAEFTRLEQISADGLRQNIHRLSQGSYVSAGSTHFLGLWTRDFAYASRGLFAIGRADVVRDQVELLLQHLREEDGLVPRYVDSLNTGLRYFYQMVLGKYPPLTDDLKPNYAGGGTKGQAIDSNLLTILAALDYVERTGDHAWWSRVEPGLIRAFRHYDAWKQSDGLLRQLESSDWQDSVVGRKGKTFYVNVLWSAVCLRLAAEHPAFGVSMEEAERIRSATLATFQDRRSKLFLSIAGYSFISLDGILLALDLGVIEKGSALARETWNALKMSEFWTRNPGLPGFNTFPDYPNDWIDTGPKMSGIGRYHDSIYWSWLMGFAAKVAYDQGDRGRGDIILREMESMAVRDGAIYEIYRQQLPFAPYNNLVYKSERPFSWGIGFVLDAIGARKRLVR